MLFFCFQKINPESYPKLFQQSLESDMLVKITNLLRDFYLSYVEFLISWCELLCTSKVGKGFYVRLHHYNRAQVSNLWLQESCGIHSTAHVRYCTSRVSSAYNSGVLHACKVKFTKNSTQVRSYTRNLASAKRHVLCTRVPDELCFS